MRTLSHILIFSLVMVFGCFDLEETPKDTIPPELVFRSANDVEIVLRSAYAYLSSESAWGRQLSLAILLRGDMATIGDRGTSSGRIELDEFSMTGNNELVTAFWPTLYQGISSANAAIYGAELLKEEKNLEPLIADARFFRAFAYFHLVRLFGEVPYIDDFLRDPDNLPNIGKSSEEFIYGKIIEDLIYATTWLPDIPSARSRPGKGTAAAYLSLVYLTNEEWQKSYDWSKWVIDRASNFNYRLENDFQDLFDSRISETLTEPLLTIDYLANVSSGLVGFNFDLLAALTGPRLGGDAIEGWSVAVPNITVYERWDDRDYRKFASFDTSAITSENKIVHYTNFGNSAAQRPHIAKYYRNRGTKSATLTDNNYILMRYAEVLLIAAESLNEISGPNTEVLEYVNQVRRRARQANGIAISEFPQNLEANFTLSTFRNLVMEERRLELAFEWKRWYDIKRRKLGDSVFEASSLDPQPKWDTNRDYLFPLPQDELNRNPKLLPQNRGYLN